MGNTQRRHGLLLVLAWAWLGLAVLVLSGLGLVSYRAGLAALTQEAGQSATLLAENLARHDAYLTALAALTRMPEPEASHSVQAIAAAIMTFTPRITAISTLRPDKAGVLVTDYGGAQGALSHLPQDVPLPQIRTLGGTELQLEPGTGGTYVIDKLGAPDLFIRMVIDGSKLLGDQPGSSDYGYRLLFNDHPLAAFPLRISGWFQAQHAIAVNSPSQPFTLEVTRGFSAAQLLPLRAALPLLLALSAGFWLIWAYWQGVVARRQQDHHAMLLKQEARLADAGRINALGEMASGLAHELAQPIAAMLSLSQAARRAVLIKRPDLLDQALDANIEQARRAGDLLGRMRAFIAGEPPQLETVPLAAVIRDTVQLFGPQLAAQGVALHSHSDGAPCQLRIDVIAFQQILHNLLRNAAAALQGRSDGQIQISAHCLAGRAVIRVADNGPGIASDLLPRIFEPFWTSKTDGMGLGLPLSLRLIERMGGTLVGATDTEGLKGAVFTLDLPCVGAA